MRGLSLWEPWASAIAHRHKLKETRPWDTQYRGEIAICSTAKLTAAMDRVARDLWSSLGIEPVIWTRGCAVAVVTVRGTDRTEDFLSRAERSPDILTDTEWRFGNYGPGRYVWHFDSIRRLSEPYPIKGRQRLWRVKPEDEAAIRERLEPLRT